MTNLESGPNQIIFTKSEIEEIIKNNGKLDIGSSLIHLSYKKNMENYGLSKLKYRLNGSEGNYPRIKNTGLEETTGYVKRIVQYLNGNIINYENNSVITDVFDRFVVLEEKTLKKLYKSDYQRIMDQINSINDGNRCVYTCVNITKDAYKILNNLDKCEDIIYPNKREIKKYRTVLEYLNCFPDENGELYTFEIPSIHFSNADKNKSLPEFENYFISSIKNDKTITKYYGQYCVIEDKKTKTIFVVYSLQ